MKSILVLLGLVACTLALPRIYPRVGTYGLPGRIVGGSAASPHELPYQVSLRYGGGHICGGSVLNANYIVTAGHCVIGAANSYSVSAGDHDIRSDTNDGTEQIRSVSRITRHAQFSDSTLQNDIAVFRLSTPLTLNANVRAVTLPASMSTATGNAVTSGWGATREGGSAANVLQKVTVPIITDAKCNSDNGGGVSASMICAGFDQGGKDACQGDSGGPLAQGNTLIGIVSWGYGCARPGKPGVYTEVSHFITWLSQNTP